MFVFMLSSISGPFGRLRRGTLQVVNEQFAQKLFQDRAARKATQRDAETVQCLACLMERAIERDASVLISAEIGDDEQTEETGETTEDIERENAQFDSEQQFDKFASGDD